MTWSVPVPTPRGRAAVRQVSAPSLPQPLPGSTPLGNGQWWVAKTPEQVVGAYTSSKAPVPANATVTAEGVGVVRVETPLRDCAILVSARPDGCVYTIAGSPTLELRGGGLVPDFTGFVRVGAAPMDARGLGFVTQLRLDGKDWVVMVAGDDPMDADDSGRPAAMRLSLAPGPLQAGGDSMPRGTRTARCEVAVVDGMTVASADISRKTVTVRARVTDTMAALLPPPTARLTLSKKWGRVRSRPVLSGEGFDAGERVALRLGDRKMPGTKADHGGEFEKSVSVPVDFPVGTTRFTATGARSKRTADAPYEVRPPR
jgi:hypothetical protein